ncbi:LamG-like jellyroll fold domain-containing protein [Azospirillum sp.]|uniref:LamG-like jellyroll fold domain-containing protein n=1 Tax=Azospirillum sp. TaxID=34012 RepID=UPI003D70C874
MSQYRTGSVNVTNGSPFVIGVGTAWLSEVQAGQQFSILRSGVAYTVASVESDTRLTLSAPYRGAGALAAQYTITRDFTPYYNIPFPGYGDIDTAALWKEAVTRIEQAIVEQDTGLTVIESRQVTVPPATPDERVNYIVPAAAQGAWNGQTDRIAVWDQSVWKFIQPKDGWRVYLRDESYIDYVYDTVAGVTGWHPGQQVGQAVAAAQAARDEATAWATKTDGPVSGGAYSAKTHALEAAASATAAEAALSGIDAQLADAQIARDAAVAARDAAMVAGIDARDASTAAATSAVAAESAHLAAEAAKDATLAAQAEAQSAEAAAAAAQLASQTARDLSQAWATKTADTVDGVEWSAKHYAAQAGGYLAMVNAACAATEAAAAQAATKAGESATSAVQATLGATTASIKAGEAAASAASATQSTIDALSAKGDAVNARDLTNQARDLALSYRQLAQAYAETAGGQQVEPGLYSAKHWAMRSQESAEQAALVVGGNNFGIVGDGTAQRLTATAPGELFHLVGGSATQLVFNAATKSVTFNTVPGAIEHQSLAGTGANTHAQIDAHLTNTAVHVSSPLLADVGKLWKANGAGTAAWSQLVWSDLDAATLPTALADYGITDAYTKAETYAKSETYAKTETYAKAEVYTKAETDQKFTGLIGGATPEQLDTLYEITQSLNNDADLAGTLASQIAIKANSADVYTKTETDSAITTAVSALSPNSLSAGDSMLVLTDTGSDATATLTLDGNGILKAGSSVVLSLPMFGVAGTDTTANRNYLNLYNPRGGIRFVGANSATSQSGTAGLASIQGGFAAAGSGLSGAGASVNGGTGDGVGNGGGAILSGGTAGVTGNGGNMTAAGGSAGTTSGNGGNATVQGGSATNGNGGNATMQGGSSANGNGGAASLIGRNGTGTNSNGGNANVTAGNASGSGTPGNVNLTPGTGGVVKLGGTLTFADGTTMTTAATGSSSTQVTAPIYAASGNPIATVTAKEIRAVYEQIAGATFNLDYSVEANYIQQDAANGTDLTGGAFVLHNTGGAAADSNTKLLIHADGLNGSTEIVDERGITPFGTSCMFLADDAYFNIPKSYKMAFGTTQDYTIEFWVRPEYAPSMGEGYVFDLRDSNTGDSRGAAYLSYNYGTSKFSTGGAAGMVASATSAVQQWHHVAVVRYNGTRTLYVDGVNLGSTADTTNYINSQIWFGKPTGPGPNGYSLNGWLSNFHVSKKARYTANFTRPSVEFTRDSDTVYLFKGYDGHGSQFIRDHSKSGHEVAILGAAAISNTRSKFGATSLLCDGTSNAGAIVGFSKAHNDFNIGADDFTIDGWVYPVANSAYWTFFKIGNDSPEENGALLQVAPGGSLLVYLSTGSGWNIANMVSSGTVTAGQWTHLALMRSGSNIYVFVNGVVTQTFAVGTAALPWGNKMLCLGRQYTGNNVLNGNIDGFRVKRGEAAFNTAGFTPPVAPHTTDDRTVLLLHFEGANGDKVTLDSSESSYGNNAYGDTTTPALAFNNSAALAATYTRGGHGTSLLLNGTNQCAFIQMAQPAAGHPAYFATGEQFCIEGWFYIASVGVSGPVLWSLNDDSGGSSGALTYLWVKTDGSLQLSVKGNAVNFTGVTVTTGWHHVALVRDSASWIAYVDGTSSARAPATIWPTLSSGTAYLALGSDRAIGNYLNGAIDSVRLTHGKPRYQSNFTPDNLTQDDDTALLWVFDGAVGQKWVKELSKNTALIQATNARTVRDGVWFTTNSVGISTAQTKYGTGSMKSGLISGGKGILVPDGSVPEFGSQNWVVESWVYKLDTGGGSFVKKALPSGSNYGGMYINFTIGGIHLYITSNTSSWEVDADLFTSGLTTNAWHHLAIVRSGSTIRGYLNGTLAGSVSYAGSIYDSSQPLCLFGDESASTVNAYFDEFRLSMGTDRGWTGSTITVPTMAYGQQYVTGPYYVTTADATKIDLSAWESLDSVTVNETINPGTSIKYLVSFDGRATWKYWTGSAWTATTLANIETVGNTSAQLVTGLLTWAPAIGTTVDIAASLKTTNQSYTPVLDGIVLGTDQYEIMTPRLDYTVKRNFKGGISQPHVISRVRAGNANHVVEYVG